MNAERCQYTASGSGQSEPVAVPDQGCPLVGGIGPMREGSAGRNPRRGWFCSTVSRGGLNVSVVGDEATFSSV